MLARSLTGLLTLALAAPPAAGASAAPVRAPAPPLPGVEVSGPAVLEEVCIEIDCAGTDLVLASARCRVRARAIVGALEPVELRLPRPEAAQVLVDGAPATGTRPLDPGSRAHVELSFERALAVTERDADAPWVVTANRARHVFLGESTSLRREGESASGTLFDGVMLTVRGPIRVDARGSGAVQVVVGAEDVAGVAEITAPRPTLAIAIEAAPAVDPVVQHGGPYLALGVWGALDAEEPPFLFRVGYELALVDHVILGVAFETDFDSIAESVLVEIASPEILVIFPSVSAGVGAVARQLGQREADAALRLHVGYQLFAVGATLDFDYWPATGGWTIAGAGRLSF